MEFLKSLETNCNYQNSENATWLQLIAAKKIHAKQHNSSNGQNHNTKTLNTFDEERSVTDKMEDIVNYKCRKHKQKQVFDDVYRFW